MINIRHETVATGLSREIDETDWDNPHTITGTPGKIIGFDESGDVAEITVPNLLTTGLVTVPTRAEMAGLTVATNETRLLTETGRFGVFKFIPTTTQDLSAKVAADPLQGIYVAGLFGTWVRQYDCDVYVNWFGTSGLGVINDSAAVLAAIAILKELGANNRSNIYKGSNRLRFPAGHYFMGTTTIDLTHTLILQGEGSGLSGGEATQLRWSAGATAIRIQRFNTSGAGTKDAVTHFAGDACMIRGFQIKGGYASWATTPEGEFHGVHAKARFLVEDCVIENFQGDGIHMNVSAGGIDSEEGNANLWQINRVTILNCRNGLFVDGADVNAGSAYALNSNKHRQFGVNDQSFLGNSYISCHFDANGINDSGAPPTLVSHSGNRYYVIAGQEAGASTNAPSGTTADNTWWGYAYAGGVLATIPAWTSGVTYRAGGAFYTNNVNAANIFMGCYSESGQAPAQIISPTLVVGGLLAAGVKGASAVHLTAAQSALNVAGRLTVTKDFQALAIANTIGSTTANSITKLNGFTGQNLEFWSNNGSAVNEGSVVTTSTLGMFINGRVSVTVRHNGVNTFNTTTSGLNLPTGKVLQVNNTQVVTARQTGTAPVATDLATALTLVNDLRAKLITHGLIS